jgi:flagellin-like protein
MTKDLKGLFASSAYMKKSARLLGRGVFDSRKGLSPLIATVLLIAFAVALGVMVMNWGKGKAPPAEVPGKTPGAGPLLIKVEPYTAGQKTLLCFDPMSYDLRPDSTEYKLCSPNG